MKRLSIFIYLFLFALTQLTAQVDLDKNEKFELLRNYEVSTGKNLDTKSLFKLTRNGELSNNLQLSYEQKISPSFSIIGSVRGESYYKTVLTSVLPTVDTIIGGIIFFDSLQTMLPLASEVQLKHRMELSVEGRYYLHQDELIEQGAGNNVNGLYVSAGLGITLFDDGDDLPLFSYFGVGVQSRILKYGILDFSLLASYKRERITINPSISAGFAISKNYKNLEFENARCNILKCFEERNFQFKIPLTNSFIASANPSWNHGFISIIPRVKFEHKLFKGLSFNHTFQYSNLWNINSNAETSIRQNGARFGYANSLRWYILKLKNIVAGKSADNLSGVYVESFGAINLGRLSRRDPNNIDNRLIIGKARTDNYGVNIGYQTRLFKNLYVDILTYVRRTKINDEYDDDPNQNIFLQNNPKEWTRYGVSFEFGLLF